MKHDTESEVRTRKHLIKNLRNKQINFTTKQNWNIHIPAPEEAQLERNQQTTYQ